MTPHRPTAGRAERRQGDQPTLPFEDAPLVANSLERELPADPVFIRHPRARRYMIHVRLDGTVRVTIPRRGSKREATAFVERQRRWIEKQVARCAADQARPREEVAPERARELWARARRELPPRLLELAARHGLAVKRVSVRNQRCRWGSCSLDGHICLNWRLVAMPDAVRDYVLVHELMHLKRMNHSPTFWKLVAQACPEYRQARAWLRGHEGGRVSRVWRLAYRNT